MKKFNPAIIQSGNIGNALDAWDWISSSLVKRLKFKNHNYYCDSLFKEPRESYLLKALPKGTDEEKHMYLKLSSFRNYFDYIENDDTTLPLVVGLNYYSKLKLLTNRLLVVNSSKIYFKNEV